MEGDAVKGVGISQGEPRAPVHEAQLHLFDERERHRLAQAVLGLAPGGVQRVEGRLEGRADVVERVHEQRLSAGVGVAREAHGPEVLRPQRDGGVRGNAGVVRVDHADANAAGGAVDAAREAEAAVELGPRGESFDVDAAGPHILGRLSILRRHAAKIRDDALVTLGMFTRKELSKLDTASPLLRESTSAKLQREPFCGVDRFQL